MPCWTIETASVAMPQMRGELLRKALEKFGATKIEFVGNFTRFRLWDEAYILQDGVLSFRKGAPNLADRIKVGYSRQVIAQVAKTNRWTVKEVRPNEFEVVK